MGVRKRKQGDCPPNDSGELIRLQTQLEFIQQNLFGNGKDTISARLSRIEGMLYRLNREQGVLTGKVAIIASIIATIISALIGLLVKFAGQ